MKKSVVAVIKLGLVFFAAYPFGVLTVNRPGGVEIVPGIVLFGIGLFDFPETPVFLVPACPFILGITEISKNIALCAPDATVYRLTGYRLSRPYAIGVIVRKLGVRKADDTTIAAANRYKMRPRERSRVPRVSDVVSPSLVWR